MIAAVDEGKDFTVGLLNALHCINSTLNAVTIAMLFNFLFKSLVLDKVWMKLQQRNRTDLQKMLRSSFAVSSRVIFKD
jgi:hypothetical protein